MQWTLDFPGVIRGADDRNHSPHFPRMAPTRCATVSEADTNKGAGQ
jgi:hypothetical protein